MNSAERKTGHTYGRQTAVFADELQTLLSELKESSVDPRQGIELVLEFFRSDEILFEQCDDSDGILETWTRTFRLEKIPCDYT